MPLSTSAASRLAALRQRPWARRAICGAAALLTFWLVAWLAVPPLLKGPLERAATAKLGRPVTVGAVDFKPWTLELSLRDVAVAGADGAPPALTIGRIHADGELESLLRLAPVVDALTVENPVLRITHLGGGGYDVDDIIAKLTAPPAEPAPGTGAARLALYNLALTGGSIDFIDQAVGRTHEVRSLTLQVPFISTLESQREIKVEPYLAFALDGSRFDSSAAGTPFTQTRHAEASIRWHGLDLKPYLGYLPASLPVRVQGATLDVDVKLAFEQAPRMAVKLTGTVQARNVRLSDRQGADLLAYENLRIDMTDVRPLERVVHLGQVTLTAPVLRVARDASGQTNLAPLAQGEPEAAAPKTSPVWAVRIDHAAVRSGTLHWADATTRPAAQLEAGDMTLDVRDIALPLVKPFGFEGGLRLHEGALRFTGEAAADKAEVRASVQALPLQLAAPYWAHMLEPAIAGQLTGELGVQWQAPARKDATGVTLTAGPLALEQFTVKAGKATLASMGKLAVNGAQVALDDRTATLDALAITRPEATVDRDAEGRWMFQRWMKAAGGTASAADGATTPWKVQVADFSLEGGAIAFTDRAQPRPVALEVSTLNIAARNLASDGATPQPLRLSARITDPGSRRVLEPGRLVYQGTLAAAPLSLEGRVNAARLPLHTLDGYLASAAPVQLLRAEAGFRGQVALAQTDQGTRLRLTGDAVVEDLQAHSTAASTPKTEAQVGEELLAWKSLNLRGIAVATAPGTAPRVEVAETGLTDFFARITVNEAGRINLAELAKTPAEAQAANAAAAPSAADLPQAPASAAASAPAAAQADPLAPIVRFGPVSLVNGRVAFADRFVKPNYSANLSELTGRLSAFSSEAPGNAPVLAALELRGKAEGSAALEISGQLNPLARPLALDIVGRVRELELPPLSPYSVKYAGHGIERGKLSMDVNYKVLPSGQLTASNRLVLNQLAFGEPVQGAPSSLPVKLAVALLADRNGVIDLDLPISGSLNDPQFRLGPVIFRIIGNLIAKAITAPFSLLASAAGGSGDALGHVAFAPGSARLTPEAEQNLAKVVKALADRPALKLTVTGMASLKDERDGMQRERLAQLVLAEKRRANPDSAGPVSADEYPALLKAAYGRADMPKPRNLVGLAKDLSVPEMEALLLAQQPATEALAADLAQQRGQAVRTFLLAQQLPAERLFIAAPKTGAPGENWTPRAQLSLGAQ